MIRQGGRPVLPNAAGLGPENKPTPPRLDLRSAPYPLTHTYALGVHVPLRGMRETQRVRRMNHDASSL